MKVVILAGGKGLRISAESAARPKPMIEVGNKPLLWHIMRHYSSYGYHEFIICCGYKGMVIKKYFADYYLHQSDVTFDFSQGGKMTVHNCSAEPWKVTLIDTGLQAQTGARIKRIAPYLNNEPFMLTYGDGVSDVDLDKLRLFHEQQNVIGTISAVQPEGRFGVLDIDDGNKILQFREKQTERDKWINGGFMILEPEVFRYISDQEDEIFERRPLERMAEEGKLAAYKHTGFWHCMDTMQDKIFLDSIWDAARQRFCG